MIKGDIALAFLVAASTLFGLGLTAYATDNQQTIAALNVAGETLDEALLDKVDTLLRPAVSAAFVKCATRWRSISQSNGRERQNAAFVGRLSQAASSVASSAPSSTVSPSVTCRATTRPAWGLGMSSATLPVSSVRMLSSRSMTSPILTNNSRMKTRPLAHEPQLCQHSGYFGMRTKNWLIEEFPENPLHSTLVSV